MSESRHFNYKVWVADFETSTEPWAIARGKTEVWAYALTDAHAGKTDPLDMSKKAKVYTNFGKRGNPFDLFLEELLLRCHSGDKVYFHNLKFDGQFLLSGLLERGFRDTTCKENTMLSFKGMFDKSFSVLVAGSSWYSIKVEFGGKRIEFRDSLKRIPMGVKRMAKEFNLPIMKGDIEYDRDPSLPMTEKELEYIRHDVLIVAEVLRQQYAEGFTQLTTAGFAFKSYKNWLKASGYDFDELFPKLDYLDEAFVRRAYEGGEVYCNPRFKNRIIGDPMGEDIIGHTWDNNSMYPAAMSSAAMPYGEAMHTTAAALGFRRADMWSKWRKDSSIRYFVECTRCIATVKPGRIPSIGVIVGFGLRDYPEQINIACTVFADVRFEQLMKDYDIEYIELGKVVYFNSRLDLFFDYLQSIVAEKNAASIEGNIMRKYMAKVKMNSLYGKFGQKPISRGAYFEWDEECGLVSTGYDSDAGLKYIPIAATITAEARRLIVSQANKFGSNAVTYIDTDSIHVIDDNHRVKVWRRRPLPEKNDKALKTAQMNDVLTQPELIKLMNEFMDGRPGEIWCDEFDLGAFKIEGQFACAKWLRAKTYFEATIASTEEVEKHFESIRNEEWNGEDFAIPEKAVDPSYYLIGCIKGAGIPNEAKMSITVENFNVGLVLPGKLQPKKFKGGVVLHETSYEIKEHYTAEIQGHIL